MIYNEISPSRVDGQIFRSTQHGLNADFIKMFDYAMKTDVSFPKQKSISLNNVLYRTKKNIYYFDYNNLVPILRINEH